MSWGEVGFVHILDVDARESVPAASQHESIWRIFWTTYASPAIPAFLTGGFLVLPLEVETGVAATDSELSLESASLKMLMKCR
jgi:hypothetical protein